MRTFAALALVGVATISLAACGGDVTPPPAVDGGGGADLGGGGSDARVVCTSDVDCNDGLFCNGREMCAPASSMADARGCTPGDAPCSATETCDETANDCRVTCEDLDGDGHESPGCGGDDCDDADASRYPGGTEVCNAADEDCNDATLGFVDADGDGVASSACCNGAACGGDCNDGNADIRPGALDGPPDACNTIDDDCDGSVDEGCPCTTGTETPCYTGAASTRGIGRCVDGFQLCVDGMLQETCNDQLLPDAEICDTLDNDCDGLTNEDVLRRYYRDGDADGFGLASDSVEACSPPMGYVSGSNDCNDDDANRNPGAFDACNGIDDDCDGEMDEGAPPRVFHPDTDGDGFGATGLMMTACDPPAGFVLDGTDCDDASAGRHPGAFDGCNTVDDDCDGAVDESAPPRVFHPDADGDGFGAIATTVTACDPPLGHVIDGSDCDDANSAHHPGAYERCDAPVPPATTGVDDDCDGTPNEGCACAEGGVQDCGPTRPALGRCVTGTQVCVSGVWGDCAGAITAVSETCNGRDDDCDGSTDETLTTTCYADADSDGRGAGLATQLCGATPGACPTGWSMLAGDCNDSNGAISPVVVETCNGRDDDCDMTADDGFVCTLGGLRSGTGTFGACTTAGSVSGVYACNGTCTAETFTATVPPEACDGLDNNCNGVADDGFACTASSTGNGCTTGCGTVGTYTCSTTCTVPISGPLACRAASETCNGCDDDGVLGADNGLACVFGTSRTCSTTCGTAGTQRCLGDCSGYEACRAAVETCNACDDDLNGRLDDGFACVRNAAANPCTTACGTAGTYTCSAACAIPTSGATACTAAVEACNGCDDDRDGAIDEGFLCVRGATRSGNGTFGACTTPGSVPGFYTCNGDCSAEAFTATVPPETCDGTDNNCNGVPDDGYACVRGRNGIACVTGCGTLGAYTCSASCTPGSCGAAEVCNACDDDGNGSVDEGVTVPCYADADDDGWAVVGAATGAFCPVAGRSAEGGCPVNWTQRNPATTGADCADDDPSRNPGQTEPCNGVDDDCDGTVDDGASSLCVASSALTACLAGRCVVTGCNTGRSDCDRAASNGCETDTASSATNCGACGVRCSFGTCTAGLCSPVVISEVAQGGAPPGGGHTCARLASGKMGCWGRNQYGQLGDGSGVNSLSPVEVPTLSGVVDIAVGSLHTCAVLSSGDVYCWGINTYGQLGDGTVVNRPVPTRITTLSGVGGIAANADHTCAWLTAGGVRCWGRNSIGQLGDGTATNRSTPTAVIGIADAVEVATGQGHTCARHATGAVSCWGQGFSGQLGDGFGMTRSTPVVVVGIADAQRIAVGSQHSCAVRATGAVMCWGLNNWGQLGDGTTSQRLTATTVPGSGLPGFVATDATTTASSTCARLSDGTVSCWGYNNVGQLGNGTFDLSLVPVPVGGLADAASLGSGPSSVHVCVVRSTGALSCWGSNAQGQLGDGTTADSPTVSTVRGLADPTEVSAGSFHTCARRSTGAVECWGQDATGQLGDGTVGGGSRTSPSLVVGLTDAMTVLAASSHTCALRSSGRIACWGNNGAGQLGDGTTVTRATPADAVGITTAVEVVAGGAHTCARLASGTVMCWGQNVEGVLGDGTTTNSSTPVTVVGLTDAVELVAGSSFNCARRPTGSVVCWGRNGMGNLGNGTTMWSSTPVAVLDLNDAIAVAAGGGRHACALKAAGPVVCWGGNGFGQIGDATATPRTSPVQVIGLLDATDVGIGADHTCARRTTSTAVCWGRNREGELGDGATTDRYTPVAADTFGPVLSLAGGGHHTCAIRIDRSIACLGENLMGQLGDGTMTDRLTATNVLGF